MTFPISSQLAQGALLWIGAAAAKASVVLIAAFVATRWRVPSAATRHAFWVAAVATAVAIPVAQFILPAWEVALLPTAARAHGGADVAPLARRDVAAGSDAVLSAGITATVAGMTLTPSVEHADVDILPVLPAPGAGTLERGAGLDAGVQDSVRRMPSGWPELALSIWLLGAAIVLAPWAMGVRRRTSLWRRASPDLTAGWRNAWRYLPTAVDRAISVRATDLTAMPMTWGVLKPVVLVPLAPQWTAADRRAALLHEVAHIARFDTVWQGISRCMLALFWFNPLAWIADAMLRAESECACDDAVLRAGTRASEYAQQLLDVVRTGGAHPMHAVAALRMARRSGMADRLRALLDARQDRGRLPRHVRLSLVAVSGAVAIPAARLTPVTTQPAVVNSAAVRFSLLPENAPTLIRTRDFPVSPTGDSVAARVRPMPGQGTPMPAPSESGQGLESLGGAYANEPERGGTGPLRPNTTMTQGLSSAPGVRGLLTASSPLAWPLSSATVSLGRTTAQDNGCLDARRSSSSSMSSESHDGRLKSTRVKWSHDDCRVTFDLEGDVTFNADATDVVGLSGGGSLELQVKDGSHIRRVQLDEKNGGVVRQLWIDGDRVAWDAAAATWFAGALIAIDRRTAFAVGQRLPLLLKKGGVDAALSDIELMYSDFAQRVYYTKLFKLQPLSVAQVRRVLVHVKAALDSDYERAELLVAIAKLDGFGDESYVDFATAASGIKSAYEKRRALSALLAQGSLKPAAVKALLEAGQGMDSDYELAELLVGVAKQYAISDDTRPLYLAALGSLNSDYEHRRVLDAIVKGGGLTPPVTRAMIKAATRITSDYELAEFLVHLAAAGTVDASNVDDFFAAHATIESDYESHRVLTALLNGGRTERDVLLRVLKAVSRLDSDYERASLLVEVAGAGKMDDTVRAAYEKAAEGVKSEYEYGRAIAALRKVTRSF